MMYDRSIKWSMNREQIISYAAIAADRSANESAVNARSQATSAAASTSSDSPC
jgi:hypothetical protein